MRFSSNDFQIDDCKTLAIKLLFCLLIADLLSRSEMENCDYRLFMSESLEDYFVVSWTTYRAAFIRWARQKCSMKTDDDALINIIHLVENLRFLKLV